MSAITMKEIKFRAWDSANKQMFYSTPVDGDDHIHDLETENGTYWEMFSRLILRLQKRPYTLMQFTGRKDKNGKHIYEGDIVRLRCGGEDSATARHGIMATIEWHDDRFRAVIPDKKVKVKGGSMNGKKVSWREIHTWCGMHTCLTHGWGYIEVVGNIYENSEQYRRK